MSLVPTIDFPPSLPEDDHNVTMEIDEDIQEEEPIIKKKELIDDDEVFHKPKKISRPKTPERSRDEPEIILPEPDNKDIPNGRRVEDIEPVPKAPKKKRVLSEKQKQSKKKKEKLSLKKKKRELRLWKKQKKSFNKKKKKHL